MQKRKLTKRERKCMRAASFAVQCSMNDGYEIEYSDRTYRGADPVYTNAGRKIKAGVPYVRTS